MFRYQRILTIANKNYIGNNKQFWNQFYSARSCSMDGWAIYETKFDEVSIPDYKGINFKVIFETSETFLAGNKLPSAIYFSFYLAFS